MTDVAKEAIDGLGWGDGDPVLTALVLLKEKLEAHGPES